MPSRISPYTSDEDTMRGRQARGIRKAREHVRVPIAGGQIHQHGAAGIGHIGDRGPPVKFHVSQAIDGAEQRVTGFGLRAGVGHVVQQPAQFEAGEIAGERQAGLGAEAVLTAVAREVGDERIHARILPDQRVVQGPAGVPIPEHGGFALVGDADRGEIGGAEPGAGQRGTDHLLGVGEDFDWVVLDPAGLWIDLPVLLLRDGDHVAALSKTMKRELVVPWSMAPIYWLIFCSSFAPFFSL